MAFYTRVFGFVELFRDGPNMVFLCPPGTSHTITLNEQPDFDGRRGGIEHFGLRLTDKANLDAAILEIEAAGGRLLERGEHAPGTPYAYVEDPDGHMIEL